MANAMEKLSPVKFYSRPPIFTIASLLLLITGIFGFIAIRVMSLNQSDTWFNSSIRPRLAAYPSLRGAFALHFDGDARSDYFSAKRSKILIEVVEESGIGLQQHTLEAVAAEISQVTGKQVEYSRGLDAPAADSYGKAEIRWFADNAAARVTDSTAVFRIFVLNRSAEDEDMAGMTVREDSAAIFLDALDDVGGDLFSQEVSTILHEFGHQLGMQHNDIEGCLMNARADVGDYARASNLVLSYCAAERAQLQQIKNLY